MYLSYDIRPQVRSMMDEAAVTASVSKLERETVSRENQPGQQWRRKSRTLEKDD
jgi:hypothetical protein